MLQIPVDAFNQSVYQAVAVKGCAGQPLLNINDFLGYGKRQFMVLSPESFGGGACGHLYTFH